MKKDKRLNIEREVEQWIDSIERLPEQKAPSFFVQKVMNRIENPTVAEGIVLFSDLIFWRSIAASLLILLGINFYTVINFPQQLSSVSTENSSSLEVDSQMFESGMIENFSLLAQDDKAMNYEYE